MKPHYCKASQEHDEFFCPYAGLRWDVSDSDYTPECQSQCLSTTERLVESESVHAHQQELRQEIINAELAPAELPTWASERKASIIFFGDQILVAHPDHPLKVLHPGAKKFVDVTGIT